MLWISAALILAGGFITLRNTRGSTQRLAAMLGLTRGRSDGSGRTAEEGTSGIDFSASSGWFRPDKYY